MKRSKTPPPVRRSRISPLDKARNHCIKNDEPSGLEVRFVNDWIGCGLFATCAITSGDFIAEYRGNLTTADEIGTDCDSTFHYYFGFKGNNCCIDASANPCLAKFANDDMRGNSSMKVIDVQGSPHLCLFASADIKVNDEVRYDYGVSSLPWRLKQHEEKPHKLLDKSFEQEGCKCCTSPVWIGLFCQVCQGIWHEVCFGQLSVEKRCCDVFPDQHDTEALPEGDGDNVDQHDTEALPEGDGDNVGTERVTCSTSTSFIESTGGTLYFDSVLGKYSNSLFDTDKEDNLFMDELTGHMYSFDILNTDCQAEHPELKPVFEKMLQQLKEQESTNQDTTMDEEHEKTKHGTEASPDHGGPSQIVIPDRLRHLTHLYESEESEEESEEESSGFESPGLQTSSDDTSSSSDCMPSTSKVLKVTSTKFSTAPTSKRMWDRVHCCLYCEKVVPKIARHLQTHHAGEALVVKALLLPKKSSARNAIFEDIRKKGDYAYNSKVIKEGMGELLVYKRPKVGTMGPADYLPCPHCHGYFVKTALWRHESNCTAKKTSESPKLSNCQMAGGALLPTKEPCSSKLQTILASMRSDGIVLTIRGDEWICKYGEHHVDDGHNEMTCRNIVSEKMRRIAGLLLEAKKICPNVESAKDLIDPSNFTKVVQAVRVCSGFNASTQAFASPSLANKLGQSLAVLAELVISDAIETGNTENEYKAEQFLKLKKFKWKKNISSKVYKQQCKQTWEKPKKIPLTADTVKLNQLILNKTKETKQKIESDGVTTSLWRELASLTLSNVITFNRRRPGETQFLNLDWYQTHITKADEFHDEIYQSLPLPQKLALKRLTLIMTRGKKGRGVPIMLTEDMVESLTILNENREAAGVSEENPYVFACPSDESVQPLRGHQCLKQYAKQCGAKHPSRLTATNLRKHLATVSQILNLSSSELEQLANHLGHDVNVHRQYYRLPQDIIFLAKVSKLLLKAEEGSIHDLKGQSLDDCRIQGDQLLSDIEIDSDCDGSDDSGDDCVPKKDTKKPKKEPKKRVKVVKTKWSETEESAIMSDPHLQKALKTMHPPNTDECLQAKSKHQCLQNRSVSQIKSKVWNLIQRKKKRTNQTEH